MAGLWPAGSWPAGTWAAGTWPGWEDATPTPTPGVGAGLWPAGSWPAGSWPAGSWPGWGAPPVAPVLPEDLVDAIDLVVQSRLVGGVIVPATGLVSAGPPVLAWFGTGDVPPDTPLPYASYTEPAEDDRPWDAAGTIENRGQVQVQAFAAGKKAARALGDQLRDCLLAAARAGDLAFGRGTLFWLSQASRTADLDPDPGPDGETVWVETRIFEFRYTTVY